MKYKIFFVFLHILNYLTIVYENIWSNSSWRYVGQENDFENKTNVNSVIKYLKTGKSSYNFNKKDFMLASIFKSLKKT